MAASEIIAIAAAFTALLGALGVVIGQLRTLTLKVDGRLSELLELTRASALAEGVRREHASPVAVAARQSLRGEQSEQRGEFPHK